MKQFIATIDLRNANEKDFANLDAALLKASFKRNGFTKKKKPGISFSFSEYVCAGDVSIQEVISNILKATKQTGRDYAFTVVRKRGLNS